MNNTKLININTMNNMKRINTNTINGDSPYIWNWSNGDIGENIINLAADTFLVYVTPR